MMGANMYRKKEIGNPGVLKKNQKTKETLLGLFRGIKRNRVPATSGFQRKNGTFYRKKRKGIT